MVRGEEKVLLLAKIAAKTKNRVSGVSSEVSLFH